MKIFNIYDHFNPKYQECIIGSKETGRHGVYIASGVMREGDKRILFPDGHEEIFLLVSGALKLGESGADIVPGQAIYLDPAERLTILALADSMYVVAGAHATAHAH